MKRYLFVVALFLTISPLYAQGTDQGEEPIPPRRSSAVKIGGAVGFTSSWLLLDVAPLNAYIRSANARQFTDDGMILLGGQGYAYILFLPNVRVGGLWSGGMRKSRSVDVSSNTRRDVELSVGLGALTIDYVIPVTPRIDISVGGLLGGGSMDLKLTRDEGRAKIWGSYWNTLGSQQTVYEYSGKLSGSFFIYQPAVNVEYAVLRWLGVRAGVSYMGMSGGSWKLDDTYEVLGVPDNINAGGWMFNGGIFVGTFVF